MTVFLWALGALSSFAVDAVDGHGVQLGGNDGDLADPVVTIRPETQTPMSFGANLVFDYADAPIVLFQNTEEGITSTHLLDNVAALNLGIHGAFHERIAVIASAPLFLASQGMDGQNGFSMGDLRVSAPIGLVLPDVDEGGFGLSVVPFIDLPTGDEEHFLGNAGVSGGGVLAAGFQQDALSIALNLGVGVQAPAEFVNLRAGARLITNISAQYQLGDYHSVGVDTWLRPRLAKNEVVGSESPGEMLFFGRGRYSSGLSWVLGGGFGITGGAAAANFRLFSGIGWTFGKNMGRDTDGDGFYDKDDQCIDAPETVNDYQDTDGCPDTLASVTLTVLDEDGVPLEDAYVTIDGQELRTDSQGVVTLNDLKPGPSLEVQAEHPWCASDSTKIRRLQEGTNTETIRLALKPARVKVITKANTGEVLDATVTARGPAMMPEFRVGDDGEEIVELRPGTWEVLVSAPDFGVERRDLTLAPGEMSLIVIEVVLQPAKVRVEKKRVVILDKVFFDYDKDTIMSKSLPLLTEVANTLRVNPELLEIEIAGHTDTRGSKEYNEDLSQRRVESVRNFLMENGVSGSRLTARGYGESKPLAQGSSESAHAKNRRVEFNILRQTGNAPSTETNQ